MKQLLIVGTQILAAGYFFDDADELRVYIDPEMTKCDAIYPHHVMEGYGIAEVGLPDDFTCAGYEWQGGLVKKPEVVVIPTVREYTDAVQSHLDAAAQARNYDDIVSACSYAGAPNPFQAEGAAFVQWRGAVWASCYQIMAAVQEGQRTAPTIEGLIAELPALVLP